MNYPPAFVVKSWLTEPVKLDEHDNGYVYVDMQVGKKWVILYIDKDLKIGYCHKIDVTHFNDKEWEIAIRKGNANLMDYWKLISVVS